MHGWMQSSQERDKPKSQTTRGGFIGHLWERWECNKMTGLIKFRFVSVAPSPELTSQTKLQNQMNRVEDIVAAQWDMRSAQ